jgi:hypothetical protein
MPAPTLRTIVVSLLLVATLVVAFRHSARPAAAARGVVRSANAAAAAAAPLDPAACLPSGTAPGEKFADAVAAQRARAVALAKTRAFEDWLTAWRRADEAAQPALAAQGAALATERRGALKHLIETDPRRALEFAVPVGLRAELPADVQAQLETRLDARGDFEVGIACLGTETRTIRRATIDGKNYEAFVFGRRETQGMKTGLPLHGIAVDGVAALYDTPYRHLDDSEKATRALPFEQPAVLVGDKAVSLATSAEFTALERDLIAAETGASPAVVSLGDTGDPVTRVPGAAAVTKDAAWITGEKRVLWLKLEFGDDPGEPVSDATLAASSADVNTFYQATSHGRTSMAFTTVPTLLRVRDKAYYNTSGSTTTDLRNDALAAAKAYDAANGNTGAYDPDKFDRWIMIFKRVAAYNFGGLGNLGGPTVWLNNSAAAAVTGHELGHNQSLDHSHSWLPSGTSPIGPGTHVEYGDVFDRMGSSSSSANNFFNVAQKFKLGYLDAAHVTTITTAGTYRLTRHDHKDSTGVRAFRVGASNVEYDYWIEHRRLGPTALTTQQLDRLQNGVILHWGPQKLPNFVTGVGSYLIDTTPGSAGGTNDAPLRIGETFTDPNAGITIKPLAVGGTAPNEYIDVQISFGAVDGNRDPVLVASAPAGPLAARTNLTVSASATDPDGDSVYYRWDFGDGKFQPNLNTVTTRFAKGGAYPVTVSAHDGKGGIAVKTYTLNVSDPLTAWTKRTNPFTTNNFYDVVYAAGKFVVVGDNGAVVTSADGTTWARATTPSNAHFYRGVAHNGSRFATVGVGTANPAVPAVAAYSNDGTTWTTATVASGSGSMVALAFGAGRFVAVGGAGRVYTSTDGAAWIETASPVTASLRSVTFANGLFVAGGDSGRLITSSDGLTWTNRSLPDSSAFGGIAYFNGAWFASSGVNEFTSPDGVAWRRVTTKSIVNFYTQKAIATSGVFMGVFQEGRIQFTEDGQTWTGVQADTATNAVFRSVAEGAGALVAVGNAAAIFSTTVPTQISPPLAAPSMRLEGASLKVSVGRKNIIAAGGAGYTRLELYANGTKVSEISGQSGFFSWTPTAIGNYALSIRGVDATGASAMSASYPAQAGLASWNWRNPGPVGSDLTGAVRVDGKWWIVGNTGNFVTLDVAGQFAPVDFATTQNLTGIGYANGRFVLTAPYTDGGSREPTGDPWVSTDGFAWTALYTASLEAISLNFVAHLGGRWIATGGGVVLTSTDGLSWSRQNTPVTNALLGAAYGNNLYVVVGTGGKIVTSPTGVTWTERTSGVTTDLRKVAFSNGTFVAAGLSGVILTSTDGTTWTRRTISSTANLYGAGVIKGTFVVAGDSGRVLTSDDGATWAAATIENRTSNLRYVVGADGEGLLLGTGGEVYTATTATSYKRVAQGTSDNRNSVIYAGGKFVAVGQAVDTFARSAALAPIAVSTNGVTWTRANANSGFTSLNDVTYGQSRYVAVGDNSGVFTSTDGVAWTQRTLGFTNTLTCVTAGPSLFVAASSGAAIYSSPDGTTWTQRANSQNVAFRGATYANGRYIIVGDGGGMRTSTDGITWTTVTSGTTANLLNVSYFDNVGFLAAGATGTMLNSTDGLAWRVVETGISDTINSIASTPIGLLAPAGTAGTMLMSLDGINWSIGTIPVDRAVRGVASNASTIVAVGDTGALLTYDLVDPTPAPTIVAPPSAAALTAGAAVTLTVSARDASGGFYQWFKDGVPIVGANGPTYTTTATAANLGNYTVAIATPTGSVTSAAALLSLANASDPARLINLSILTPLAAGETMTMGTALGGAGTSGAKALLIRAVGPSLAQLGVTGALPDPRLAVYSGQTVVASNDDWGGSATLSTAFSSVGAFPYASTTSKDAAIYNAALASGNYTVQVTGGAGIVIAELYDSTPAAVFTATTPRLANVSVLKQINAGESLTAGFVVGGSGEKQVLIRAIGPGLAQLGVQGTMADPQLTLNKSGVTAAVATNNDWGGTAALSAAFASVGAFALPAASKDAAILVSLAPGNYTAQVTGVAGSTGLALVEVYEVP